MSIFPALLPSQSLGPKVCERDRLPQAEKPAAEDQALHDAAEGNKQREETFACTTYTRTDHTLHTGVHVSLHGPFHVSHASPTYSWSRRCSATHVLALYC